MKSFFKFTLASFVGVLIALIVLLVVLFGVVGSMVSSAQKDEQVEIESNTLLLMKLNTPIVERASNNPLEGFNFQTFEANKPTGLNTILNNIRKASTDENISGIVMSLSSMQAGMAQVEEIREALIAFKDSGKYILSYADTYTQKAYYLASVADTIYMHPEGGLGLAGLNAQVLFFKNMMEKVGVEPVILRHGKFKSAVEPFMLEKMSEANREQTKTYLFSLWNHMRDKIAEARGMEPDELQAIVDELETIHTDRLIDMGLIDKFYYKDELLAVLDDISGEEEDDKDEARTVSLSKYDKVPAPRKGKKGLAKNKVAVIYGQGQIVMGNGSATEIGGRGLAREIRKAREDDDIKAIVLRINSPGGSALASDIIWREVILAQQVKPVVASMSDLAASGGYYIACAADTILANPTTLTGSIGVFGLLFNAEELMNEKIGITTDIVKTAKYADLGDFTRSMTQEERDKIMVGIEDVYDTFIGHVAEGRNIPKDSVDAIGQGRVWSGANAKEIGLVDEFGGLQQAIALAAEMAGVKDDYRITELPEQKDPFEQIMAELTGKEMSKTMMQETGILYRYVKALQTLSKMEGVQARLPYLIEIE